MLVVVQLHSEASQARGRAVSEAEDRAELLYAVYASQYA